MYKSKQISLKSEFTGNMCIWIVEKACLSFSQRMCLINDILVIFCSSPSLFSTYCIFRKYIIYFKSLIISSDMLASRMLYAKAFIDFDIRKGFYGYDNELPWVM